MRIVAFSRTIREDTYRIPEWKNAPTERDMQAIAEGTEPRLMELTRSTRSVTLEHYRAGISATDDFLNDSQTRASDITNAVEEIAIQHRIALLAQLGRLIHDSVPSGNNYTTSGKTIRGQTPTAGQLDYPWWTAFLKEFGDAYTPSVTLGNKTAITNLELMPMQSVVGGSGAITYGSWTLVPNTNIENLNGNITQMAYGYIPSDALTLFGDTELFTFDRATTLIFIQQSGMEQDETERRGGPRLTIRWLGRKSRFAVRDPQGIWRIGY